MTVVSRCNGSTRYQFKHTTLSTDSIDIHDEQSLLYVGLSIGVARLKAKLERASHVYVSYTIVGNYSLGAGELTTDSLAGDDCSGATHILDSTGCVWAAMASTR